TSAAAPSGTGDPGCSMSSSYAFSFASPPAAGSIVYLALPFGSWTITSVTAALISSPMASGFAPATQGELTGQIITLDPRVPS
ncbi:MAG: hypothetical protein M3N46_14795, partial [Actinomycetota bacterium]|nr:hypothetical protein [Actinomycetota bacterium]